VLLSLGYGCGLRAGEVVRLKVKHIDKAQKIIRIEQSTPIILAGSQPAVPTFISVRWIPPRSRQQSCRSTRSPFVYAYACSQALRQTDRGNRSGPSSERHASWPNPHRDRRTDGAILTAISCLGASRTPAARKRRWHHHAGVRETCTKAAVSHPCNSQLK
jgi:hypothetical protein